MAGHVSGACGGAMEDAAGPAQNRRALARHGARKRTAAVASAVAAEAYEPSVMSSLGRQNDSKEAQRGHAVRQPWGFPDYHRAFFGLDRALFQNAFFFGTRTTSTRPRGHAVCVHEKYMNHMCIKNIGSFKSISGSFQNV